MIIHTIIFASKEEKLVIVVKFLLIFIIVGDEFGIIEIKRLLCDVKMPLSPVIFNKQKGQIFNNFWGVIKMWLSSD